MANFAPTFFSPSQDVQALEDTLQKISIQASDPDGDTLTYSILTGAKNGATSLTGNTIAYTPNKNFNGLDSVIVLASDGKGGTARQTVNIVVAAVNDAPNFAASSQSVSANAGAAKTITLAATDEDGDALTYTVATPSKGSATISGSTLTYTPTSSATGTDSFVVTARDPSGATATQTINVTLAPLNRPPTFSAQSQSISTIEDIAKSVTFAASDADGDAIMYRVTSTPANGTVSITGSTAIYTPNKDYNGPDIFVVQASDGRGGASTQTVNVMVSGANDAPSFLASSLSVSATVGAIKTLSLAATDIDGDTLTYTVTTPSKGSAIVSGSTLTYTPISNASGADSFIVTARDPSGATATQTINVSLRPTQDFEAEPNDDRNNADYIKSGSSIFGRIITKGDVDFYEFNITEKSSIQLTMKTDKKDEFNQYWYVWLSDTRSDITPIGIGIGDGKTYIFNALGAGTYYFRVTAGSLHDSGVYQLTLKLNPSNQAPKFSQPSYTLITYEDTPRNISVSASDPDGDKLTYTLSGLPSNGSAELVGGEVRYTPKKDYYGGDAFFVTASDGNGGTATQRVNVSVTAINDAPQFSQSVLVLPAVWAGTNQTVTLSATDVEGDAINYFVRVQPKSGSVSISGNILSYRSYISVNGTPISGRDSVEVLAREPSGLYGTQTIYFDLMPNRFPTFKDLVASTSTTEDATKTITFNATDADGDSLTYSVSRTPTNGTTTISGSTVTYTPKANYNGTDSFVVTASDGKSGTATQTVNVTVTAVNDAPAFSASSQSVSATAGTAKAITLAATDVDGDKLTYTVATPSKGSATISGSTLTYTPTASASGTDSFVVTARDPSGATATQTINVTVAGSTTTTQSTTDFRVTASDGWTGAIGGNGLVYGTSGYQDIKVLSGTVTFDASFNKGGDIVRFDAAASSYTVARAGSSAQINAGTDVSAVIPVGTAGMVTSFSDGVRKLVFANSNFALGAQTFSTSATTISAAADGTSLPTGASSSASARISLAGNDLRSGQTSHITIGGKSIIYGNAAKSDVVAIASGVNVDLTFDASFNRGGDTIILDKSAGSYSAIRSGASIILTSTSQTLTIPVGTSSTTIKFADDSRALVYSTSEAAIKLGTQTIATTSTAILPSSVTTSLDVGTSSSTTTVSGANGKVIFTDDATKSSYVKITNFGSDDIIRVTGATEDKYSFTNADLDGDGQADDLSITFSNPDAGVVNDIQIINAVSSTAFIADKASAISAVGFNFISFG